ncbi:hypothetical protein [Aphanothece sacrum]|uniref:Uncharacterized protein n=1 Tax=Aphanothece sacrum FPU1 TaxID=1920663 RepID=A0A401ICA4_APHSA|nr:hypothetical protein [Aphanothece sacrum]GBF78879.1 hypothetical protein AsFPU1_0269 [Aphanothece sacrum FPU1]GBF83110.1 hypothetical protein AsFPU3_0148 [Aphanothece sacrum FPU3]
MTNIGAVNRENNYQTTCYRRQGNQLLSPESCQVTMEFEHPENGLNWKIVTRSGQVHHYRNLGTGIQLWSHLSHQWVNVKQTDWFPEQEGILCWDDFCADWRELPLD